MQVNVQLDPEFHDIGVSDLFFLLHREYRDLSVFA
jgi:hypothetical protein